MSCVDVMYQLCPSYLSYKGSVTEDVQKFSVPSMYEMASPGHYSSVAAPGTLGEKEEETEKEQQPKGSQYLNPNCLLLTYFSGDISSVVDEHFTRALSQPSSYNPDRQSSKVYPRPGAPLMCQRKFPPSFWDSTYQSSTTATPHNFHFSADAYLNSSLYAMSGFHKTWPYSLASQPHTYTPQPAHSFSYTSMDSTSRYSPHYGSFMMQSSSMGGRMDSRHGQYDLGKSSESFGTGYYTVPRLSCDMGSGFNLESSSLGLDVPVQQTKKEFYW